MPKRLEAFSTAQAPLDIGTKADFIKLQARHAVVGADSEAIRDAVEKIEKITPSVKNMQAYVRPHDELMRAVKAFKGQYAKKHPKFIAAVEADFVEPVSRLIDEATDWLKQAATLPKYFTETIDPLDDLNKLLSAGPLDDAKVKQALVAQTAAGSSYNNALSNLQTFVDRFEIDVLRKIKDAGVAKRGEFEKIGRVLQAMQKSKTYDANLLPVVTIVNDMADTCQKLAKAVSEAKY